MMGALLGIAAAGALVGGCVVGIAWFLEAADDLHRDGPKMDRLGSDAIGLILSACAILTGLHGFMTWVVGW